MPIRFGIIRTTHMKEPIALVISIILLLLAIFAYPLAGAPIREAMTASAPAHEEYNELVRENIALKSSGVLQGMIPDALRTTKNSVYAFVYSRYPFNYKNELLVDAGTNRGITVGDFAIVPTASLSSATASDGSLRVRGNFLGVVEKTFEDSAVVRTIFDADFERAVRIGSAGIDALISGGDDPKATLIPKRAQIAKGDIVYASSPDLPYGIPIGTVKEIVMSEDGLFREAKLNLGYDVNEIKVLQIVHVSKRP
jgi:cell shape-determining protein MreC